MAPTEIANTESPSQQASEMGALVTLLVILLLVGLVTLGSVLIWGTSGMLLAASLALASCLVGAVLAHFFGIYPRGDAFLVSRLYLSMAARTGLPLAVLMVCKMNFETLLAEGMVYFVILFYLVGLLTELKIRMRTLGIGSSAKNGSTVPPAAKMDV